MYVTHELTIAVITVIFALYEVVPLFLAIAVNLCHGRDYHQNERCTISTSGGASFLSGEAKGRPRVVM